MGIKDFFEKVGHDIKVAVEKVGHAFAGVFIKLFGLQAAKDFVDAAEALLKTEFGQILTAAVEAFLAGMAAGTPYAQIIRGVVVLIITEAQKAGISVGEEIAHLLATLILNKLQGNLAAVSKVATEP